MAALRARHTYASEDSNLKIVFRANCALMGDVAPAPAQDEELNLTVEISDADEPAADYRVEVFRDRPGGPTERRPVQSYDFKGNTQGAKLLDGVFFQTPGDYVLLKVTQRSRRLDDEVYCDRAWTAPIWFETTGFAPAALRLVALTPDPDGSDLFNETVTVKNTSGQSVTLAGWQLRDESGNIWSLDPARTAQPSESITLKRNREAPSLNNAGDTIELMAPDGRVVQSYSYGQVARNEVVNVP